MEHNSLPPFEVYSRICRLAGQSALRDIYDELDPAEHDELLGLPNRSQSLEGEIQFSEVTADRAIAKKLYICPCCDQDMAIGDEHVLLRIKDKGDGYDHHHVHRSCFNDEVLPIMLNLKAANVVNRPRSNRHRQQHRRAGPRR